MVAGPLKQAAVDLVMSTQPGGDNAHLASEHFRYGASPRASQCLILGGKARAVLSGRYHVDFEDVQAVAVAVLRHRLVLNFHARAEGATVDKIIHTVLSSVRNR